MWDDEKTCEEREERRRAEEAKARAKEAKARAEEAKVMELHFLELFKIQTE